MDPLTVTAGIIAILGAGGIVGKRIKILTALKSAPDELLILNNEISDLQYVLNDVQDLLRQQSDDHSAPVPLALMKALKQSRETVKVPRVDKSRWLRAVKNLETYKSRIQRNRLEVSAASALMAASLGVGLNRQLRQMSVSIENLISQDSDTRKTLMQHMQVSQVNWLNATNASRRAPWITPDSSELKDGHTCSITNNKPRQTPMTENSLENATISMSETKQSAFRPRNAILDVVARSCGLRCQCLCHEQTSFRSPAWLSPFLGSLFVSSNSLRACNSKACRAHMTRVAYTYAFPFWFLDRVLTASITKSTASGPELLFRLMRIRAPESAIFIWSIFGSSLVDAAKIAELIFDDGAASVLDITPSGLTALHCALLCSDWKLAELLVQSGTDIFYVDAFGRSRYSIAWTSILGKGVTGEVQTMLQTRFSPSHLDDLDLPDLHKALMGLSGRSFDEAVDLTGRSAINAVDASRRTALSWAAERGNKYEISRLLMCGADPNIADLNGMTPLHWGALAGEAQCVQALLLAKADIEAQDKNRFTALFRAETTGRYPGCKETMDLLLANGACVPSIYSNDMSASNIFTWVLAPGEFRFLFDYQIQFELVEQEHEAGSRTALKDDSELKRDSLLRYDRRPFFTSVRVSKASYRTMKTQAR